MNLKMQMKIIGLTYSNYPSTWASCHKTDSLIVILISKDMMVKEVCAKDSSSASSPNWDSRPTDSFPPVCSLDWHPIFVWGGEGMDHKHSSLRFKQIKLCLSMTTIITCGSHTHTQTQTQVVFTRGIKIDNNRFNLTFDFKNNYE